MAEIVRTGLGKITSAKDVLDNKGAMTELAFLHGIDAHGTAPYAAALIHAKIATNQLGNRYTPKNIAWGVASAALDASALNSKGPMLPTDVISHARKVGIGEPDMVAALKRGFSERRDYRPEQLENTLAHVEKTRPGFTAQYRTLMAEAPAPTPSA